MFTASNRLKAFATRFPFLFALTFFVITLCLNYALSNHTTWSILGSKAGALLLAVAVQALLALGVLLGLGWLRTSGFNGPSQWRSVHLLWLPALLAIFSLSSFYLVPVAAYSAATVILATIFVLLTGLSEEAAYRGLLLRAFLPYGVMRAAALSALFFGLGHLNNLLVVGPSPYVFIQIIGAVLLGFGFAACRLRTKTIWPLIILHACYDLFAAISIFNPRTTATSSSLPVSPMAFVIVLNRRFAMDEHGWRTVLVTVTSYSLPSTVSSSQTSLKIRPTANSLSST